ncbi:MAG: penicillin-binding protein [Erysipelotrichaceae bacterium]|jgi:penicillin-binding protein 2B|nr:penicillin-binding protein [Erysipelotrichaceae bacterium]
MKKNKLKRQNRLIKASLILVVLVFSLLFANVCAASIYHIHLRSNTDISLYALNANTTKVTLYGARGTIYDAKNNVISQDITTYKIYAILSEDRKDAKGNPAYVADTYATAEALSPLLRMSVEELMVYLTKENVYQVELGSKGSNLSLETKKAIEDLHLPGIGFIQTSSRDYPMGAFSSHIIGFTTKNDDNVQVGQMGLEAVFDDYLQSENGYHTFQADKYGNQLPGLADTIVSPTNGADLYLTLNKEIQEALDQSFAMSMEKFNTTQVWGIVMEVDTGKILAIGSYPTFDPAIRDIEDYQSLPLQYAYEPGSTMKTFTYAAAIDSGVYDGSATFDSSVFYMSTNGNEPAKGNENSYVEVLYNASHRNWGWIDYDTGFRYSSNVGIANLLTSRLSTETFEAYLEKFGFFSKVNVDGLSEAAGYKNFRWPFEKLTLGYGQGSAVTAIQMVRAYAAILNDGVMVQPYLVQAIKDHDTGEVLYQAETTVLGQPVSTETALQMQKLMSDVVNTEDGTGRYYKIDEVDIIAKTGTAQVYRNGTYDNGIVISSIAIGLPADDPKIVIYYAFESDYVYNELHMQTEPVQYLIYRVAQQYSLLSSTAVEDSEDVMYRDISKITMPSLVNHTVGYAASQLSGFDGKIITLGSGNQIIRQYPQAGQTVLSSQIIILKTDYGDNVMPDMYNWTIKEINAFWQVSGQEIVVYGQGQVKSQNIPAATILKPEDVIEVVLE